MRPRERKRIKILTLLVCMFNQNARLLNMHLSLILIDVWTEWVWVGRGANLTCSEQLVHLLSKFLISTLHLRDVCKIYNHAEMFQVRLGNSNCNNKVLNAFRVTFLENFYFEGSVDICWIYWVIISDFLISTFVRRYLRGFLKVPAKFKFGAKTEYLILTVKMTWKANKVKHTIKWRRNRLKK